MCSDNFSGSRATRFSKYFKQYIGVNEETEYDVYFSSVTTIYTTFYIPVCLGLLFA